MNESYHIMLNGLHQHEHKSLWPEALHFRPAHSSEYFFNLMDKISINPVVSSGLKLSNESIDASFSEYSFSVLLNDRGRMQLPCNTSTGPRRSHTFG
jgi:hypothetical protein